MEIKETSAEIELQMEQEESALTELENSKATIDQRIYELKIQLLELTQKTRQATHEIRIKQRNLKAMDRRAWALRRMGK